MVPKFGHVGAPIRAMTYVSMVPTPQANTLKLDDCMFATLEWDDFQYALLTYGNMPV